MNEWMNEWTNETNEPTNERTNEWMKEQMNEWTNERTLTSRACLLLKTLAKLSVIPLTRSSFVFFIHSRLLFAAINLKLEARKCIVLMIRPSNFYFTCQIAGYPVPGHDHHLCRDLLDL